MDTFFDAPALLDAAALPSGIPNADEVARKIANDGLVQKRALALAVESFVLEAVRQLSKPERDMLQRRVAPFAVPAAKVAVYWEAVPASRSTNGQMYISASHGAETMRYTGAWQKVSEVEFFGERVPAEIAEIYILNFSAPRLDPEGQVEKRKREREELEAKMARQSNTGDAALAAEALSRMPKF